MKHQRLYVTTVFSVLLSACSAIEHTPRQSNDSHISIASIPSGADVYVMGKKVGMTPLKITDRDIYPVSYSNDVEQYYGKVILRKEGCGTQRRRLTRSEVRGGLTARLECKNNSPSISPPALRPDKPSITATNPSTPQPESLASPSVLPEKQLEQLRLLQKLQEQGVLSDDEERKLRKRILDGKTLQPGN